MEIRVENLSKRFHNFEALKSVNLTVASGELVALLGPSGSGKTTLLRIIAGLERPDHGSVLFNGVPATERKVKERNVGFVFQHYALFKNMTVFENVAFGLRVRPKAVRPSNAQITEKVMELLRLVHVDAFYDRHPHQLSGGQRQRVALARALAVEPKLLLLDEPFGALDAKVREELRRWMRRLHDEMHITSVFVTHDQDEAMEVADRVVVMNEGRIEQIGTPDEVYNSPANSFVYNFLGSYNEFDAWRDECGSLHVSEGADRRAASAPIKVYARPHEMSVSKSPEQNSIRARVVHLNPAGSLVKLELERAEGNRIHVEISRSVVERLVIRKGDHVSVRPTQFQTFEQRVGNFT